MNAIKNAFSNNKAHVDPMCLAFPIVSTILGLLFIFMASNASRMSGFDRYLLLGFVVTALISIIMRTVKHGLGITSAVLSFVLLVICILMLRFALGVSTPSSGFIANYLTYIISTMLVGVWVNTFLP